MQMITFETAATRYSVAASRIDDRPELILFCFGLCGSPMTAAILPIDTAPDYFQAFCEDFSRHELSETDLWVGFLVLRYLLGFPVVFEHLPTSLQREALQRTITTEYFDRLDDTTPSRIEEVPFLARELSRWPADWQQLEPIRDTLRIVIKLS